MVNRRQLYAGGPEVCEIGFGGWGIGGGWGDLDDERSTATLHAALDAGIDFLDTAHMYGEGHSERVIGEVLRDASAGVRVATKVPPKNRVWPARPGTPVDETYPYGHIRAHTEQSLQNLGVASIDLQQAHVWSPEWLGAGDWQREVTELKADGLIGAYGVSVNDHEPESAIELIRSGVVDTVQVVYNIFDQSPEDGLLDACAEHGVGVIVRVALDEGGLTGEIGPDTRFESDDWRNSYFRGTRRAQVHERLTRIAGDLDIPVASMAETALRYVLSSPAVSCVVVGMRSPERVRSNIAAADGMGLPADQLEVLHRHRWTRNFYDPDLDDTGRSSTA